MYDETLFYFLAIVSIMMGGVIVYKLLTRNVCYHMNDCIKKGHEIKYEELSGNKFHFCRCETCGNYWYEFHKTHFNDINRFVECEYCTFSDKEPI